MELTDKQKSDLLSINRTADHMFNWVYNVIHSGNITSVQYNTLMSICDMTAPEQKAYIIYKDDLYPVPVNVKKYQKTQSGWRETKQFKDMTNRPRKYKKDK